MNGRYCNIEKQFDNSSGRGSLLCGVLLRDQRRLFPYCKAYVHQAIPTPSVNEIADSPPIENGDNADNTACNVNTENADGGDGGEDSRDSNINGVDVSGW